IVSKAREDLPEPDKPVKTISLSRGRSSETSRRLCSRAPRTTRRSAICGGYRWVVSRHPGPWSTAWGGPPWTAAAGPAGSPGRRSRTGGVAPASGEGHVLFTPVGLHRADEPLVGDGEDLDTPDVHGGAAGQGERDLEADRGLVGHRGDLLHLEGHGLAPVEAGLDEGLDLVPARVQATRVGVHLHCIGCEESG